MLDLFRPGLLVLFVLLPIALAWRLWLKSDRNRLTHRRKFVSSTALYVASADVLLTSFLWFYFWAVPFSGNEVIRWALLFGVPVSLTAIVLLVIGHGRGWWLATGSSAITLGGWIVAYRILNS